MENISKHISYLEATKSQTAVRRGIDNTPSDFQLANMKLVAENCFEPLREAKGKVIGVSSFLRSEALNKAIGGSKTSQHMQGAYSGIEEGAIDIDADIYNNGLTNKEIFEWLESNVEFDQLIWEFGTDQEPAWVHVSYRKGANRNMKLKASRVNGKTKYTVI
jgi:hypothetical protein